MNGKVLGMWLLCCVGMTAACVESACFTQSDCPDGKVCFADGKCRVPDCTSHADCGQKKVCESYVCVDGCTKPEECGEGQTCSSNRCVPIDEQCQCPSAPGFCLKDVNPASASLGTQVCSDALAGKAVVLFFGSIACSHCHTLYNRLLEIRDGLVADGVQPNLLFVNLKTVPLDPGAISSLMPNATLPLLQDTEEVDVWGMFSATWYEVVLIDKNGCLAWHSGDLSSGGLEGAAGEAFVQKWKQAEQAECGVVPDVVVQPDVILDGVTDTAADVLQDQTQPDQVLPPDAVEWVEDLNDLSNSDLDSEPMDINFQLSEYCQIEPVPPIQVGDAVPHFLCMNRSVSSGGLGEGISDITLKTLVWIAYTGACT